MSGGRVRFAVSLRSFLGFCRGHVRWLAYVSLARHVRVTYPGRLSIVDDDNNLDPSHISCVFFVTRSCIPWRLLAP